MSEFIDDVAAAATLAAHARGIALIVRSVHDELAIEADQQILAAVVGNLLENAFKFTRPHATVTLSVSASADRVIIDVQDECGGLQAAVEGKKLSPSFDQQGATGPAWALDSRPADGAPRQTMAGSMHATFLNADASLPWTSALRRFGRRASLASVVPQVRCCILLHLQGRTSPRARDREAYGARLYVMLRQPWLELVPATALRAIAFSPHFARWEIGVAGWIEWSPHGFMPLVSHPHQTYDQVESDRAA